MKKFLKFLKYFSLIGIIVMLVDGQYGGSFFYLICFLIIIWFERSKKNKIEHTIKNNNITDQTNEEIFCPKCGTILENTLICPNCNELATTEESYSNENFKVFLKNYATELVLLRYTKANKIITSDKEVPLYFKSECQIYNIKLFMNEILEKGYLRHSTDAELLEVLKVSELKEILKKSGISQTGNKSDLINKIIDNNLYNSIFSERDSYYILSDYGQKFYEQNSEYIELHRHQRYQINLKEYYNIRKKFPKAKGYSYKDCLWNIFQKRTIEYSKNRQYYQLYYNYTNMLDLTYSEEKYNVAITLCLKCIIYDLCGVDLYNDWQNYLRYKDSFFKKMLLEHIDSFNYINENNFAILTNIREFYSLELLKKEYDNLEMNFKLCSFEIISKIIEDLVHNSQFNIREYLPIIKKEYKNKIKKYL